MVVGFPSCILGDLLRSMDRSKYCVSCCLLLCPCHALSSVSRAASCYIVYSVKKWALGLEDVQLQTRKLFFSRDTPGIDGAAAQHIARWLLL